MKVLQVPFNYYPDAIGGTEIYAATLSQRLRAQGIQVDIAAVGETGQYVHEGIRVHRFGRTPGAVTGPAILYGSGDPVATREFSQILDRTAPDLVHLHAMSPAVSVRVVEQIRNRAIPIVFTCHIPGILCPRSTLLRYGTEVCDGVWGLHKCSACSLQNRGLPIPAAVLLAALPARVGKCVASLGWEGAAATALRMTDLQARRRHALLEFLSQVDRVVAVSGWLRDMLAANGVPPEKMILCRHGSTQRESDDRALAAPPRQDGDLRVAFLGRLDPTKGAQILIEALRRHPELPVQLDLYGIVQDAPSYAEKLRDHAAGDLRVRFLDVIPNEQVVDRLRAYDVLAVPSQWMETGPLVVYDAASAGIPVIGSDRGGIAELVEHQRTGLLVPAADPEAWASAFARLCQEEGLLSRLRSQVQPGRTMNAVASEMVDLYQTLVRQHVASI